MRTEISNNLGKFWNKLFKCNFKTLKYLKIQNIALLKINVDNKNCIFKNLFPNFPKLFQITVFTGSCWSVWGHLSAILVKVLLKFLDKFLDKFFLDKFLVKF